MINLVNIASAKFWKARYSGAKLTVTSGDAGTKGKKTFVHAYKSVQHAYHAGAARMETMLRKGFVREEDAKPRPPPEPSKAWKSKAWKTAPPPKWIKKAPRDQLDRIERRIDAVELSHRKSDILSLLKPSIRLSTKQVKHWTGIVSRFGGAPDLPRGTKWPSRGNVFYSFICQLRLDDIAPFDLERVLPSRGVLSFFLQAGYEHDDYLNRGQVLFFPDVKKLERATLPSAPELAGGPQAVAVILPWLELSLPSPGSPFAEILKLNHQELVLYWDKVWLDLPKRTPSRRDRNGPLHRVLGYPDMNYNEHHRRSTEMLLQVSADLAAEMSFGDAQPVRCYAQRKAIAAENFAAAVFSGEE